MYVRAKRRDWGHPSCGAVQGAQLQEWPTVIPLRFFHCHVIVIVTICSVLLAAIKVIKMNWTEGYLLFHLWAWGNPCLFFLIFFFVFIPSFSVGNGIRLVSVIFLPPCFLLCRELRCLAVNEGEHRDFQRIFDSHWRQPVHCVRSHDTWYHYYCEPPRAMLFLTETECSLYPRNQCIT